MQTYIYWSCWITVYSSQLENKFKISHHSIWISWDKARCKLWVGELFHRLIGIKVYFNQTSICNQKHPQSSITIKCTLNELLQQSVLVSQWSMIVYSVLCTVDLFLLCKVICNIKYVIRKTARLILATLICTHTYILWWC